MGVTRPLSLYVVIDDINPRRMWQAEGVNGVANGKANLVSEEQERGRGAGFIAPGAGRRWGRLGTHDGAGVEVNMHLHIQLAILRSPERDTRNTLASAIGRDEGVTPRADARHTGDRARRAGDNPRDHDIVQPRWSSLARSLGRVVLGMLAFHVNRHIPPQRSPVGLPNTP